MQPIATSSTLPGIGPATGDPWRDVQAAMRDLQRLRGRTPGVAGGTVAARPVVAANSVERGTVSMRGTTAAAEDPDAPTGPRPTFRTTPLERMRDDAMAPDPAPIPVRADPEVTADTRTLDALYGAARRFNPDVAVGRALDIVT